MLEIFIISKNTNATEVGNYGLTTSDPTLGHVTGNH